MVRGALVTDDQVRDALERAEQLTLDDAVWQPGPGEPGERGHLPAPWSSAIDDLLVAVTDDLATMPVHASWHAVRLSLPPYLVTGELPTMPGYDPGRALSRPGGNFLLIRDAIIALDHAPDVPVARSSQALINRYAVERVEADIPLGVYFPGAGMRDPEPAAVLTMAAAPAGA